MTTIHAGYLPRPRRFPARTSARRTGYPTPRPGPADVAPRSGQQAAIGADVIALLDTLDIPRAIFAGYDWGGRAACVAAALWPERCAGIVCVNSYLIQDISSAMTPIRPDLEAGFWYFYYFLTERGRAGLEANRREIAKVIWTRNSPRWQFDDTTRRRQCGSERWRPCHQVRHKWHPRCA
jgi:pimeloyl-ACP methyl ester carboxylesterase